MAAAPKAPSTPPSFVEAVAPGQRGPGEDDSEVIASEDALRRTREAFRVASSDDEQDVKDNPSPASNDGERPEDTFDFPSVSRILYDVGAYTTSPGEWWRAGVGGLVDATEATANTMLNLDHIVGDLARLPEGVKSFVDDYGLLGNVRRVLDATDLATTDPETGETNVDLPDIEKPETGTGKMVRSVVEFLAPFGATMKALKSVDALQKGGKLVKMGTAAFAGGVAGFVTMTPDKQDTAIQALTKAFPALENPISDFLSVEPGDTTADRKFKNALAEAGFGVMADTVFMGMKALRAARNARGQANLPNKDLITLADAEAERALGLNKNERVSFGSMDEMQSDSLTIKSTDKTKDLTERLSQVGKFQRMILPNSERVININLNRLNSVEDIRAVIERIGKEFDAEFSAIREAGDPTELLKKFSDQIGIPMDKLAASLDISGLKGPKEVLALRMLLASSAERLAGIMQAIEVGGPSAALKIQLQKSLSIHSGIQAFVNGKAAEAGRTLAAFRVELQAGEGARTALDRLANASTLSDNSLKQFAQAFNQTFDPANPFKYTTAALKTRGQRWGDAMVEWWINSLVSGPTTHFVNVISNTFTQAWTVPENLLAAATSKDVTFREVGWRMFGQMQAIREAGAAGFEYLRTGKSMVGDLKFDLPNHNAISATQMEASGSTGIAVDAFGKLVRIPTRLLGTEDVFFKTIGYRADLYQLAANTAAKEGLRGQAFGTRVRELIQDPPESMMAQAQEGASLATFTNETGNIGTFAYKLANAHPAMRALLPFVRTPVNIFRYALERTPLAGVAVKQFREDIAAGGAVAAKARARQALGTTLLSYAGHLTMSGTVTGGGPTDPDARRLWLQDHQPYSIKMGDNWVAYNRLDPFGWLLGSAADLTEVSGQLSQEDGEEAALAILMSIERQVVDKSFLAGFSALSKAMNAPGEAKAASVERFLSNLGSTFLVPQVASQTAVALSPEKTETREFLNNLRSRVPGWREDVVRDYDLFGNPIVLSNGWSSENVNSLAAVGVRLFSPARIKEISDDPVVRVLQENGIGISHVSRNVMGVKLSDEEYSEYKRLAGQGLKSALTTMVNDPIWQGATQHEKQLTTGQVVADVRSGATGQLIELFPDLKDRIALYATTGEQAE